MRIAVLDDDPILQELLKSTLEQHEHVCRTYATGAALFKDLRTETFDLLILDWHLPDMDGPQVAEMVRQIVGPQLPILFITRRNSERDVIEGLAHGGDDFMTKPLRMGELVARASALLRCCAAPSLRPWVCSWILGPTLSIQPSARSRCMGRSLNSKTANMNSPCCCFATAGVCCRVGIFAKRFGGK